MRGRIIIKSKEPWWPCSSLMGRTGCEKFGKYYSVYDFVLRFHLFMTRVLWSTYVNMSDTASLQIVTAYENNKECGQNLVFCLMREIATTGRPVLIVELSPTNVLHTYKITSKSGTGPESRLLFQKLQKSPTIHETHLRVHIPFTLSA